MQRIPFRALVGAEVHLVGGSLLQFRRLGLNKVVLWHPFLHRRWHHEWRIAVDRPEAVKHVLGFRQFMLRGFEKVKAEWNLVCMAANIKKMHALKV